MSQVEHTTLGGTLISMDRIAISEGKQLFSFIFFLLSVSEVM